MSTIVTRAGKGSVLTHAELDANFTNLNTDKADAVKVNGPAFSAHPTTAQTIASSGTLGKINFGTEEFDTNNNFASSRFTPTVAGYYQVNSCVRFDGGGPGTGECMLVIFKNGNEAKRGWNSSGINFANDFWSMSVSSIIYCNGSTDYLEIYAQQVSGGSRTTSPYANISFFQAAMIRSA